MAEVNLSVIIPAYTEGENLRLLLPKLNEVLNSLVAAHEVIVVDTVASTDDTPEVCKQYGAVYKNREINNDYGNAVRTGIKSASGIFTVFMDADGSHDPEFIRSLYQNREGFDVVIASRYVAGGNTDNPLISKVMSLLVNTLYSVVLGLPCKDVSNSFKLYHTAEIKQVMLHCDNFDIIEEILFKLKKNKPDFRAKEIPFSFKKRIYGKTKRELLKFIISYTLTMLKLRFGK